MDTTRVVRVALPVSVIRTIDDLIHSGTGGYATRTEFILDAVMERQAELTYGDLGDSEPRQAVDPDAAITSSADSYRSSLPSITLIAPRAGCVMSQVNLTQPEQPLYGMHNRDFPSLWALSVLAEMTQDAFVAPYDFYASTLEKAWKLGATLRAAKTIGAPHPDALFPTNPDKRRASENAFRSFAIGEFRHESPNGSINTHGPLFDWGVAAVTETDDGLAIGVTEPGWRLLEQVDGITPTESHPPLAADAFLHHLDTYDPPDRSAFTDVLVGIGSEGTTRPDLLQRMESAWTTLSENELSTNTAGYVARGREWGLIEPKLRHRHYQLTDYGHQQLDGGNQ